MNKPGTGRRLVPLNGYGPACCFSPFRMLIIPLVIYGIWVVDTFLLEGSLLVFSRFQPYLFVIYTGIANIFLGIIVPIVCLKYAFLTGAVNMFQIGFRSWRRTLLALSTTTLAMYLLLVTFTSFGSDRMTLVCMIAFMVPVAIASVMICWVFAGTHLQAYVRSYGAMVSIAAGVITTSILFGLSFLAHSPPINQPGTLLLFICTGVASALFFFSVRDIYASAVFVSFALAFVMQDRVDPLYTTQISPVVAGTALFSIFALVACQWYLSRQFISVRLVAPFRNNRKS